MNSLRTPEAPHWPWRKSVIDLHSLDSFPIEGRVFIEAIHRYQEDTGSLRPVVHAAISLRPVGDLIRLLDSQVLVIREELCRFLLDDSLSGLDARMAQGADALSEVLLSCPDFGLNGSFRSDGELSLSEEVECIGQALQRLIQVAGFALCASLRGEKKP